ncbi:LysE family transporter [Curtobacterium flaccumfaciens pv. flaccumfaciens]|uniref:LysE/ArgO family amino acid transporter n=1 Tax=Curtobacterium flaccumfaciens TaxID=2035 RepID=UPI00217E99BD|nr:LysE family transporter [Curtobacterium flaccumfaciens]MCS6567846.1 LysE family transporter [Curtobacterium flaccumfaciens pv. flaccumfaciens]MCS6583948.1 LysE family transporter [Curtobacterium flaccumfaciens pv. flaccumfaciens]
MTSLLPLLSGLGTGLALIVAIGVQNTYLLRLAVSAGLRVVAAAVVVCAVSDALLIVAGVLGVGAVVERFPVALLVIRFIGAAFLLTYGVLAARRALRPSGDAMRVADEAADDGVVGASTDAGAGAGVGATTGATVAAGRTRTAPPGQVVTMRTAVLTMLVFTWANPHVYLDTLVFLGSVANQQGADDRWLWTIGAVAASCLWFGALGFGGRLLRPLFEKPLTWRVFDGLVAVVMLAFGVLLLVGA